MKNELMIVMMQARKREPTNRYQRTAESQWRVGGIRTVLIGMVHALGQIDGPEEYVLIAPWEEPDWLKPYLGNNQSVVCGPKIQAAKRVLSPVTRFVKSAVRKTSRMFGAGDMWP